MKTKMAVVILLFCTAFTVSAVDDNPDIFTIIEKYGSIMKDDDNNWTIAHCAAAFGTAEEIHIIESSDLMDVQDASGNTPVIVSALYGNISTFRALVERGCDLDIYNERGGNCSTYLGYFYEEDAQEALAIINEYSDVDRPTTRGMSLLHYAVHGANKSLIEYILSYDIDVNREEKAGGMRPVDMARFISFQYTDLIEIDDDDVALENDIVELMLNNGSRNKSYIPMSIAVFGNFFFNIYIAIDSILENGISMNEVNRPEYYNYVEVNGSENPIITIDAVKKMFEDAGIDVELMVHDEGFEEVIDECNYSEDLYVILANMSGHPYIINHWVLISTRYRTGGYQNFLKAYESSSLFEPIFYRVDDIGTLISIKIKS